MVKPILALGFALAAFAASADNERKPFVLQVNGANIDGPSTVEPSNFNPIEEGIRQGSREALTLGWISKERWVVSMYFERTRLEYLNPQRPGCGLTVGSVAGGSFCQVGASSIEGVTKDSTRHLRFSIGRSLELTEVLTLNVNLGYGRLTWRSEGDQEASTFGTCLNDFLRPVPGCVPINDRARASGWTLDLVARWQAIPRLGAALGARAQRYRHDIYRYDALDRFLAAQPRPCEPFDYCNRSPEGFIGGRAVQRGDWWWYTAAVDFALTPSWSVLAEGEFGGSRDWRTAGLALAYRW